MKTTETRVDQAAAEVASRKQFDLNINVNVESGAVVIRGPLVLKAVVLKALAAAIQIVVDHEEPETIITPAKPNLGVH